MLALLSVGFAGLGNRRRRGGTVQVVGGRSTGRQHLTLVVRPISHRIAFEDIRERLLERGDSVTHFSSARAP